MLVSQKFNPSPNQLSLTHIPGGDSTASWWLIVYSNMSKLVKMKFESLFPLAPTGRLVKALPQPSKGKLGPMWKIMMRAFCNTSEVTVVCP